MQKERLEAISATLKSLGIVAGRVGALTFPAEIQSFESEILNIITSNIGDCASKLRTLADRLSGWKERFYSEFTTLQNIADYQSMIASSLLDYSFVNFLVATAEEQKLVKPIITSSGLSNDMVLQVFSFLPDANELRKCELVCK